jgi:cytochrome c5
MGKLLLGGVLLALAGCASTEHGVGGGEPAAGPPDGKRLYENSCNRCHALYMPRSFAADEWRYYVNKYGRRARLSPAEAERVLEYLIANAR